MPATSTKPPQSKITPGTKPQPLVSDFQTEEQLMARVPQTKREINTFNSKILRMTQPYPQAATLRAGNEFQRQQEAAIRAENVGATPYRGFGNQTLGKRRRLPDVGP